jgi:hypothetical protein
MAKSGISPICIPVKDSETVIEILSGPRWNGSYPRWEWSYLAYWWDTSPAFCGKCGRCTNPNNVEPCGHDEAKRKIRGQVFVSSLSDHEKRAHEGGRTVRYVRDGRTIDDSVARKTPKEPK